MKTLILSLALLGAASLSQAALTPDEQATAATMSGTQRARYVATREYVHRAEAIVNDGADPLTLGSKPSNVDTQYYQGDEANEVSRARTLSNLALMKGIRVMSGTA